MWTSHSGPRARSSARLASLAAAVLVVASGWSALPSETASALSPLEIRAVKDSFTNEARPRRNYGDRTYLKVDRRPRARAYISFDLSEYTLQEVRVSFLFSIRNSAPRGLKIRSVDEKWNEGRITHRRAPALGAEIASVAATDSPGLVSLDVSQAAMAAGGSFDIAIVSPAGRATRIASREGAFQPRLEILPVGPPPVRVAVAGDIACDPSDPSFNGGLGTERYCRHAATAALVAAGNYDAVLTLGDLQYSDGALWKFLSVYDPTWGAFKEITYPIPGNHEYGVPGASGYFDYFGARAGEPGRGYYSFDLGDWHIVALNTNCTRVACSAGSAQEQWLRQDLAANESRCVAAMMHHAGYSSGQYAESLAVAALWAALDEYDADVILASHDHFYERFAPLNAVGAPDPDGMVQFVVGMSGKSLHDFTHQEANSVARDNTSYGILELGLRSDGYDFSTVSLPGSTFSDSGTGTCT